LSLLLLVFFVVAWRTLGEQFSTVSTLFEGFREIPTDPQRSTPESYEFLLFSCFLLLPIKAYAEVRVEIRGGTTIPTRRYGTPYAEVRFSIRGSTILHTRKYTRKIEFPTDSVDSLPTRRYGLWPLLPRHEGLYHRSSLITALCSQLRCGRRLTGLRGGTVSKASRQADHRVTD